MISPVRCTRCRLPDVANVRVVLRTAWSASRCALRAVFLFPVMERTKRTNAGMLACLICDSTQPSAAATCGDASLRACLDNSGVVVALWLVLNMAASLSDASGWIPAGAVRSPGVRPARPTWWAVRPGTFR